MGPGPAGIPYIEYLFSRLVCTSVPIVYIILLVVLVIAGIKYIISAGEPKAIQSAHQTVTWGLLGILFLAISWLILQLIQNFTGLEVTKFTVASLPGVEGFTGSCWEAPPSSDKEAGQVDLKLSGICSQVSGFKYPVTICKATCDDPSKYLFAFARTQGDIATAYGGNPLADPGFNEILTKPNVYKILSGSIDFSTWKFTSDSSRKAFTDWASQNIPEKNRKGYGTIYGYNPSVDIARLVIDAGLPSPAYFGYTTRFTKFDKDFIPKDLIEFVYGSQKTIKRYIDDHQADYTLLFTDYKAFDNFDWDSVYLVGMSCSDADFYPVNIFSSPLIYFYSDKSLSVKARVDDVIQSKVQTDKNRFWNIRVYPRGNLYSNSKVLTKYIPYEFLRRDFRRPTQGFVVNKEHYISFLKDNLWKSLGLTDTEIEDYWKDLEWRIPKSPYYFISLIDRSEIDRVLPMEVNPKPDTTIRNMTYILPLSSPFIPIPLPEIKPPERKGFTVLENGGFIDGL